MPQQPRLLLGHRGHWYWRRPLYLEAPVIVSHKHIIGTSGQGKSKLLASCYVELAKLGYGVSPIDPHSDLADEVLALLADNGLAGDRLLFIDFGQRDRFVPFNILNQPYPADKLARIIAETCKRVRPALAGGNTPMFENVMLAACLTLVQNNLPFAAFPSLINDQRYRHQLLENVNDPLVVQYFNTTFDRLSVKDQIDPAASSLRRVFNLLPSEELRYTIGQRENWILFHEIMDSGRLAIYDLGGLDEESQRFIGALIAHGYKEAAISRFDIREADRVPHHLIIDEFAALSSASEMGLARILFQVRKYRLTLWLAHQTFGQLSEAIANALQNTTRISSAVGSLDASIMSHVFQQYEPLAYKFAMDDEGKPIKQFYNVQDTFEAKATELQSLKPRHLMIRHPSTRRHYWFWHKPVIKIATIKTATVKTQTSWADADALRKRYAKRYMRPREDVVAEATDLLKRVGEDERPKIQRKGSIFDTENLT